MNLLDVNGSYLASAPVVTKPPPVRTIRQSAKVCFCLTEVTSTYLVLLVVLCTRRDDAHLRLYSSYAFEADPMRDHFGLDGFLVNRLSVLTVQRSLTRQLGQRGTVGAGGRVEMDGVAPDPLFLTGLCFFLGELAYCIQAQTSAMLLLDPQILGCPCMARWLSITVATLIYSAFRSAADLAGSVISVIALSSLSLL